MARLNGIPYLPKGRVTVLNKSFMHRIALIILIFFFGQKIYAQKVNSNQSLSYEVSSLLKQEKFYQFHFGHFFESDILYAILLDTSKDNKTGRTYCSVKFFERVGNRWIRKNHYDSLQTSRIIRTRFCNYNGDAIQDYLLSAGIIGTGGNETEYLFLFDIRTKSLKLIKDFENIPTTSYNPKNGVITSIGLSAGIPNFEYYKISSFHLDKIGGKEMWSDNSYGFLEKYRIVNGKRIVFYKDKRKLPIDFYYW
jgi:hypothetical protein